MHDARSIAEPRGRLGVLLPGLGAVSTTFIAGVEAIRRGLLVPVGSLTQAGTIRLGKRTDGRAPLIRDFVPLAALESLEFGAWDPIPDSAHEAARRAGVLSAEHLSQLAGFLDGIRPWKAVFEREWVKRLDGPNVKSGGSKMELAEQLMDDIRRFRKDKGLDRLVMIWCGSTEAYRAPGCWA